MPYIRLLSIPWPGVQIFVIGADNLSEPQPLSGYRETMKLLNQKMIRTFPRAGLKCMVIKIHLLISLSPKGIANVENSLPYHPPQLKLVVVVTVETLELLLPPKVCLSAP